MKLRFTQFNYVNSENSAAEEAEEWITKMEESEKLLYGEEKKMEKSPSDQTVNRILDFALSYQAFPSRNLKFIDLFMN